MLYKEACERLETCCGDWRFKRSMFDLEETSCESFTRKKIDELQDAFDDIFVKITKGAITVKVYSTEHAAQFTAMVRTGDRVMTRSFLCSIEDREVNISREDLTYQLFEIIKTSLGKLLAESTLIDSRELVRLANYIFLAETDMLQSNIYDVLQRVFQAISEERERFCQLSDEYKSWVSAVAEAMTCAGNAWYKEVKFVPGMKVVYTDTNHKQVEKTIERVLKRDKVLVFELTDGGRISLNNSRFCVLNTWVANATEYKEILHTLKIPGR